MCEILAYKSLGFELSEIKDVHDETIINKACKNILQVFYYLYVII